VRVFLNGRGLEVDGAFLGAALLGREISRGTLPYLYCGNGSCRDCNVLLEGLPDLPACRLPVCTGLSVRTSEEDGRENALSLAVASPNVRDDVADELTCDVAVIGAGASGRAAAAAARSAGRRALSPTRRGWGPDATGKVLHFEARAVVEEGVTAPSPVLVRDLALFCYQDGTAHRIVARDLILATGAREWVPTFPGSTLPGVLPCDLAERYLALGHAPGSHVLVTARGERGAALVRDLLRCGARSARQIPEDMMLASVAGESRVDRARLVPRDVELRTPGSDDQVEVDSVIVAGVRLPSIGIARALGCEIEYDADLGGERVVQSSDGQTTVPGVWVAPRAL